MRGELESREARRRSETVPERVHTPCPSPYETAIGSVRHLTQQDTECSVGVMVYNEENTVADNLMSILSQRLDKMSIGELIVVASGCTDRTCQIVSEISRGEPRVRLIVQEHREGKASAINFFIREARFPVLVMVSGDVLLQDGALNALLSHFGDPAVGMVGARPIPVNDQMTFMGHATHLLWRLHDRISRTAPKLGEMVAFRNFIPAIPPDTAVDEVSIQAAVTRLGYRLVYEPRALVYNRGPGTAAEFLRQRRRIFAGHLLTRHREGYAASTMSPRRILRALWKSGSFASPRVACWTLGTILLEIAARIMGLLDVMCRREYHVWQISPTTKEQITEKAAADSRHCVAVFHIEGLARHQLIAGHSAVRRLTRTIAEELRKSLGGSADVIPQYAGTIVAVMPGESKAVEVRLRAVLKQLQRTSLAANAAEAGGKLTLACGMIGFTHAGVPSALSIPACPTEADPAPSDTQSL